MHAYQIVLFLHIITFAGAAAVSATVHLAMSRRRRARTVGEALEWQRMGVATARAFPIALVLFASTGAYLVRAGGHAWSSGFVAAGSIAVAFLLGAGAFLGIQGNIVAKQLSESADRHGAAHAAPAIDDAAMTRLMNFNTGLVLGVVFDMATKPPVIPAIAIMIVGGLANSFAFRAAARPSTRPMED